MPDHHRNALIRSLADELFDSARPLYRFSKEIFRAAAEAQRIADYLLAFHPAYAEGNDLAGAAEDAGKEASDRRGENAACMAEAA